MKQGQDIASVAATFVLAVAIFAPVAQAQRGRMVTMPSAPVRRPVSLSTSSARTVTNSRSSNFNSFSGLGLPGFSDTNLLGGPVVLAPGFTSNFPLLENSGDLGVRAAIDPATQLRLRFAQRFIRSNGLVGGYYLLDGGGAYAVPTEEPAPEQQQQQPPVVLMQAPLQGQAVSETAQEPLPDVGEFTLVLRSGQQIAAVAFTRSNDRIVYIDKDGGRRTIAVADLDTAATARVNEERGTPLQLPL